MTETTLARLTCDEATAKRLADRLSEHFEEAAAAAFEGTDGLWNLELHFEALPDEAMVRLTVGQVAGADSAARLTFETVAAQDWVAASLAGLKPVEAGRFTVHGAHDRARIAPNRIGIEIEAALAFGTGHHGTTRGCLLALDGLLKQQSRRKHGAYLPLKGGGRRAARAGWGSTTHHGRTPTRRTSCVDLPLSGGGKRRILDIGTGTGVLAIAAAKTLRVPVLASDIDPEAITVARENVRLNGATPLVRCLCARGLTAPDFRAHAPFDLVLANILLAPLTRLAAPLRPLLAPGAHVILSGLLANQENAALAAYRPHGLKLVRRIPIDEWVTLVLNA